MDDGAGANLTSHGASRNTCYVAPCAKTKHNKKTGWWASVKRQTNVNSAPLVYFFTVIVVLPSHADSSVSEVRLREVTLLMLTMTKLASRSATERSGDRHPTKNGRSHVFLYLESAA